MEGGCLRWGLGGMEEGEGPSEVQGVHLGGYLGIGELVDFGGVGACGYRLCSKAVHERTIRLLVV